MSASKSAFCLRANPRAAFVGWPSGSKDAATGGPMTVSARSSCRSTSSATQAVSRRGVAWVSTDVLGKPCSRRRVFSCSPSSAVRAGSHAAGSSSTPISRSSSRSMDRLRLLPDRRDVQPRIGNRDRQLSDAQDIGGPLRHTDAPARIEHVEDVRALEAEVEGGQDETGADQFLGEGVAALELIAVERREPLLGEIGREHVLRLLHLVSQPHLAVGHTRRPQKIVDVVHALERHRETLETIRQLNRDGRQVPAPGLLEVRELRNLQAVVEDLPTDPPCAEGRRFPIVLLEADVMGAQVDPARLEALQVQVLNVVRGGLQQDLELMVLEEPIRVLAEAAIRWPPGRLDIGHVPWLAPQHAQERLRVHRPSAHLEIEGLLDEAALRGPVVRQLGNEFLKGHTRGLNSLTTRADRNSFSR